MIELTPEVKQRLLAPFQASEVRMRQVPYIAAYVTARVVMTRLDEAIPWQWGFKLTGAGIMDSNRVMHQDGVLFVTDATGRTMEFHERGSAPADLTKKGSDGGLYVPQAKQSKHAVSDCFKRCAVHVGVARYLYEMESVAAGSIMQDKLQKALAAVGYLGPFDDRHYGQIGGVREADLEDEAGYPVPSEGAPEMPADTGLQKLKNVRAETPKIEGLPNAAARMRCPDKTIYRKWLTVLLEMGEGLPAGPFLAVLTASLIRWETPEEARAWVADKFHVRSARRLTAENAKLAVEYIYGEIEQLQIPLPDPELKSAAG